MGTRFLQRRATAAEWASVNPILGPAEFGIETDTEIIKIGDGVTAWLDLDPAFEGAFLPIDGKAADSDKLDGLDSSAYLKVADATAQYQPLLADTDWVTSGLTITPATNWVVDSYSLRRVNNHLIGIVTCTYSGSTLTAGADGNLADVPSVITLPVGWRNAGPDMMTHITKTGVTPHIGRIDGGNVGTIDLVAGSFNGQTLTAGQYLIRLDYFTT